MQAIKWNPSFLKVPKTRLELARPERSLDPESSASTNSATWAGVPRTRIELARPYGHYPLKVACLPVPPPGQK